MIGKVIRFFQSLPKYFHFLIMVIVLLNISALASYQSKNVISRDIVISSKKLMADIDSVSMDNHTLKGKKQSYNFSQAKIGIGILKDPKVKDHIQFMKTGYKYSLKGKEFSAKYDGDFDVNEIKNLIIVFFTNYEQMNFIANVIMFFFMGVFILSIAFVCPLVLSKFKIKQNIVLRNLSTAVLISGVFAGGVGIFVRNEKVTLSIFVICLGILYSLLMKKVLDMSITEHYLGKEEQ